MAAGTQSLATGHAGSAEPELVYGRRFRTFNVVDDCNREALSIEIDLNLPALRVVRVLDRITATAVIRPCCVWIRDRNLSRWHWLNGQRNM